jgi:phenylalanyl-tRNA synthetase beta chain
MKINYQWLQDYFEKPLPPLEEITEKLIFHAFEVEKTEDPNVIDLDVLPNRAHDCLSHRGIAKEVSVLFGIPMKKDPLYEESQECAEQNSVEKLEISIKNPELCNRYMGALITGVTVKESPEWLKERLWSLGQKSINNVVDILNYVMFDVGQPLHAFDAKKRKQENGVSKIDIRAAYEGEKLHALDGETYILEKTDAVIADGHSDNVIGIAGLKGGEESGVHEGTTDIILESAHFNPVAVRKTSSRIKLRTDASLRFENEPPKELPFFGLSEALRLIKEITGGKVEECVDIYPNKTEAKEVAVLPEEINALLGTSLSDNEVRDILNCLLFGYQEENGAFVVTPPFERLDIRIKEDLIEEVGRVYGYRNIEALTLPHVEKSPAVHKEFYYKEKVRVALMARGFSEVYTPSLVETGEVETANPFAADKGFLRNALAEGLEESLIKNQHTAPLLGLNKVKIFEIGKVFTKEGEHTSLGIAISPAQDPSGEFTKIVLEIERDAGFSMPVGNAIGNVYELNFSKLMQNAPDIERYDIIELQKNFVEYRHFSQYPFVLRDVALWVPKGVSPEEIKKVIKKESGELLVRDDLFDTFEKDERVSYAFHLVFQSYEKTLTDDKVNEIMDCLEAVFGERKWEVR